MPVRFAHILRSFISLTRHGFWVLLLCVLAIGLVDQAQAAPPAQSSEEGKSIFQQKCANCHTIGGGPLVGPDLQGVTNLRSHDWLVQWLLAPDQKLAQGDPIATQLLQEYNNIPMPNLGLTETEVDALLAYLASMDAANAGASPAQPLTTAPAATGEANAGAVSAQPATAVSAATGEVEASPATTTSAATGETSAGVPSAQPTLTAGDSASGKNLFTGVARFQNGGPPCLACHSAGGTGALGGGALGPDLTDIYQRFGKTNGLTAFLTNPPTPTMRAVWGEQPLTPAEIADVVAFLQQVSIGGRPTDALLRLAALTFVGLVVLFGLSHLIWRKRIRGVRRSMVANSRRAHSYRTG